MIPVTSEMLCALRKSVSELTSQERFGHVLSVEQTAKDMARLYCPEKENIICAAALLHDVTKERTTDEHIAICEGAGLLVLKAERKSGRSRSCSSAGLQVSSSLKQLLCLC